MPWYVSCVSFKLGSYKMENFFEPNTRLVEWLLNIEYMFDVVTVVVKCLC